MNLQSFLFKRKKGNNSSGAFSSSFVVVSVQNRAGKEAGCAFALWARLELIISIFTSFCQFNGYLP